jgi:hypothetical protein
MKTQLFVTLKSDRDPNPHGIRTSLAPWIRILIEIKSWIRVRIETNADPQHWTKRFGTLYRDRNWNFEIMVDYGRF